MGKLIKNILISIASLLFSFVLAFLIVFGGHDLIRRYDESNIPNAKLISDKAAEIIYDYAKSNGKKYENEELKGYKLLISGNGGNTYCEITEKKLSKKYNIILHKINDYNDEYSDIYMCVYGYNETGMKYLKETDVVGNFSWTNGVDNIEGIIKYNIKQKAITIIITDEDCNEDTKSVVKSLIKGDVGSMFDSLVFNIKKIAYDTNNML